MSRLGLVCLSVVLIGLVAEFYFAGKLAVFRATEHDLLRKAVSETEKAQETYDRARNELSDARQKLAEMKSGWGYEWTFPPGGNVGSVQFVNGRLAVNGVGTGNGLTIEPVTDANGQQRQVAPVVHVFTENAQGGSLYVGEFVAGINPGELTQTTCMLTPTWRVSPQEASTWNFTGTVRLRSQIPAGGRAAVDNLQQTINRTFSQLEQTNLRIAEQQRLTESSQAALVVRRSELLGDPAAEDNPEHPEYKLGLVRALVDIEEERNSIQLGVDGLRRLIKNAMEFRNQQLDQLKQLVTQLRRSGTQVSQRAEP